MKALLYSPLAVLGHHFETDLEIAQKLLDEGHELTIVTCGKDLRPLQFMGCQGALRCEFCQSRCVEGLSRLEPQSFVSYPLGKILGKDLEGDNLSSFDGVSSVSYEGVDIGSAYLSSLISDLRDPRPEMNGREAETRKALEFLRGLVDRFSQILDKEKPDQVYMFNGRFCFVRPLMRLCEQRGIEFYTHERGALNHLYSLTKNNLPHDIEHTHSEIMKAWESPDDLQEYKEKLSKDWYESKAQGKSLAWRSFTDLQDQNLLPQSWLAEGENIAIYVSSEDEFTAVPGWEFPFFKTQAEAIGYLCERFKDDAGVRFFIRIHPNLRGLKNQMMEDMDLLAEKYSNCEVISPESEVSSYTLMRVANKVVTFGSTVGIEATYFKTPSILAARAFYEKLGATHNPSSLEELGDMVGDLELKPLSQEGALKYGFWATSMGIPFKHYEPLSLTTGKFKGSIIKGNRLVSSLSYGAVAVNDISKILKGEYSLWHLVEKIKHKSAFWRG